MVHPTYRAVCESLGLLAGDSELTGEMEVAILTMTSDAVWRLFICININFSVSNPVAMLEPFEDDMAEDYAYRGCSRGGDCGEQR